MNISHTEESEQGRQLQELLTQRNQHLAGLRASSRWRLTAPLRLLGSIARCLFRQPPVASLASSPALTDYAEWIRQFDKPNNAAIANFFAQIESFAHLPLFSILLPIENPPLEEVLRAVVCVQQQIYSNWELCIVVSSGAPSEVQNLLQSIAQTEPRIKLTASDTTEIAQLSNQALAMVSGQSEWLVRINATSLIADKAINTMSRAINEHKNLQIIYADEDVLDAKSVRNEHYFKPDWNLDLHLSRDLIGHFGVYRTALVQQIGGYHTGRADAMDFDLSLRCLELVTPTQIMHLPFVLFHGAPAMLASRSASDAGVQALNAHFERQSIAASAENIFYGYRIHYALPEVLPVVSLIIVINNGLMFLRRCIESIIQKTTYPNFEIIIVDNGSDDLAKLAYFDEFAATFNIRILRTDITFNYSALNNAAVKIATGELICLLNIDIEVISPNWLSEMVVHALRPDIGAVGARLWFPDDTLQHGGIILGVRGWAAHAHNNLPRGSKGYHGRMALVSEFTAVTGACLLVRKSSYDAVGGLNADVLQVSCNDVDLCLKLKKIGLRNIWTPFADLYHHESATRGFEDTPAKKARFACELAYMRQHWGEALKNDPAYSPNLTLEAQDFGLAWPPRVPPLLRPVNLQPGQPPLYERLAALGKGKVRVAYFAENVHSSTFRYRAANMAQVLNQSVAKGNIDTSAACFFLGDSHHTAEIVERADILVVSRVRYDLDIAQLIQQFRLQHKKVLFDLDDLVFDTNHIDLIISTSGQESTDEALNYWYSVVGRMAHVLRLCDGVLTTNVYLSNKIQQFSNLPVKIIPNFVNAAQLSVSLPLYQRKLTTGTKLHGRIKLGYFSGSSSHNRDISLISHALERVMAADERIDLVFVGHLDIVQAFGARFGGYLKGHLADRVTVHPFVDFVALQELIANVDFNLVPLQVNEFTHCKSELKFVDAAIVGTLTIASPTFAYAEVIRHGENGYLAEHNQWETVLLLAIAVRDANPELHKRMTAAAYQDVQQRFTWQTQRRSILQALEVS
jgi:O-antigen biosynthesis protein